MILRDATVDDDATLESLDIGTDTSSWLEEVSEIVEGLLAWREDPASQPLDREPPMYLRGIQRHGNDKLWRNTVGAIEQYRAGYGINSRDALGERPGLQRPGPRRPPDRYSKPGWLRFARSRAMYRSDLWKRSATH